MSILTSARKRIIDLLSRSAEAAKKESELASQIWKECNNRGTNRDYWSHSFIHRLILEWDRCFIDAINLPPTRKRIACGFSSNIDSNCKITAEKFHQACIQEQLNIGSWQEFAKQILHFCELIKPPCEIHSRIEVIAVLFRCIVKNEGARPIVGSLDLIEWIEQTFGSEERVIGGAASFLVNYFNEHLDERYISLLSKYLSTKFSELFTSDSHQLLFEKVAGQYFWIDDRIDQSDRPDDPDKINVIIEWSKNDKIYLPKALYDELVNKECPLQELLKNDQEIRVLKLVSKECSLPVINIKSDVAEFQISGTDRLIFRSKDYISPSGRFLSMKPTFKDSVFDIAGIPRDLHNILIAELGFDLDGFIFSAVHNIKEGDLATNQAVNEMEILLQAKTAVHVEYSGDAKNTNWLEKIVKNRIPSMGINHEELSKLIPYLKLLNFKSKNICSSITNYKNARSLSDHLNLNRLHVHAHILDVLLRRKTGNRVRDLSAIQQEIKAVLLAKYLVTIHALQEDPNLYSKLDRLLSDDSFEELLYVGEYLFPDDEEKAQAFVLHGIYEESDGPYFVAFIPSKWVDDPSMIKGVTSAGDLISGVSFVYGCYNQKN